MISTRLPPLPGDVGAWLLDDAGNAAALAERALANPARGAASKMVLQLSQIARTSLARQVVTELRRVLHDDMVDLLLNAWGKYRALAEAAAATAHQPDAERVVRLADHRIIYAHEPAIDLLVNGKAVLALLGRLEIIFEGGQIDAVVRAGRLIAVRAGHSSVTGSVKVEDHEIARRKMAWPTELVLDVGSGVNLTGAAFLRTAGVQAR
jgi:hypothetical protein